LLYATLSAGGVSVPLGRSMVNTMKHADGFNCQPNFGTVEITETIDHKTSATVITVKT